ncbi:hypothetical protein [Cereibacter sphaeroides]|uniref:hypothetical protein n=1 Tax=Cereibacter sphaeroides TaxID=1063 RepID=UPI000191C56B|nr:hypothetical protein [Cereibacter sphaeroides]ACM00239.1 Hypothetical Protein RSKD131_0379 [Cereibacter sphaeroides KD131]ACM01812.1 Hypothetical Protein RSKD131_1952 [Cereibacter sphaeroides KD131]ACM03648.1 Hypothetical Protein RSKD131_3788 [Cereibacter sphaeroides KD131]
MITIMRKVLVAEITAAIHLGAVADFWAAHARKRLGKLSQHFPQDASCDAEEETYRDDTPRSRGPYRMPSGWWLVPSVLAGSAILATALGSLL